jgi:VWFA-related protein
MRSGLWSAGLAALVCAAGTALCAQQGKPATTPTTPPAATPIAPAATATTTTSPNQPTDIPTAGSAGTLAVKANLVVIPTVVRDKKGAIVKDLKKEDFSLEVEGQAQTIRYFDHDTDVPLTLGLLVDVSGSMRNEVDSEQTASQSFLDTMLAPSNGNRGADKGFVVQFAKEVELLQDVTDSKPRLQRALKELGTSSPSFHNADDTSSSSSSGSSSSGSNTDSEGRYIRHGGTALYDAIYLSGDEVMSKQDGKRRALVVLTDGVDRGSKESLTDAIEAAQRSDTIVYGIYYKGEQPRQDNNRPMQRRGYGGGFPGGYPGGGYPGGGYPQGGGNGGGQNPRGGSGGDHKPNVDGKHVLERICGETGGRVFEVSKKQTVDDIYKQIGEELRSQYRLGFTPSGDAAKDRYHQINLALTGDDAKKKMDVQARDGYYMGQ